MQIKKKPRVLLKILFLMYASRVPRVWIWKFLVKHETWLLKLMYVAISLFDWSGRHYFTTFSLMNPSSPILVKIGVRLMRWPPQSTPFLFIPSHYPYTVKSITFK